MSTWRMSADARWEVSGPIQPPPPPPPLNSDPHLPSMYDLLLQGYSKILEDRDWLDRKSAGVNQPLANFDVAGATAEKNQSGLSDSLFQTGSGKMVNVSSAGLVRAKTLLGIEDENSHFDFQGRRQPMKQSATNGSHCRWLKPSCVEMSQDIDYVERMNGCGASNSLLQTGSGKTVNVSSASLVKARTLLGLVDDADHFDLLSHQQSMKQSATDGSHCQWQNPSCIEMKRSADNGSCVVKAGRDFSGSLFQTGSGKMVNVSSAGLVRAKTLLGIDDDDNYFDFPGHQQTSKQSAISGSHSQWQKSSFVERNQGKDNGVCVEDNGHGFSGSLFQTGSGKRVNISYDGLVRAKTLLGVDNDDNHFDLPDHQQTLKPFATNKSHRQWQDPSSVKMNGRGFSNSLFQTGSGKMVNISPTGLVRAKTLLATDDDNDHFNIHGNQQTTKQSATRESYCQWQNSSCAEIKEGTLGVGIKDDKPFPRSFSDFKTPKAGNRFDIEVNSNWMQSETFSSVSKPPQIKFQTAGGKSLSVSRDALERARSLLGEPDLGTFFDEGNVDSSSFSSFKGGRFDDTPTNKENDSYTPIPQKDTTNIKSVPMTFTSPLRSSSKQARSLISSVDRVPGNLMKKFDAVDDANLSLLNGNVSSAQKNQSNLPHYFNKSIENTETDIGSRTVGVGRSLAKPLVDITNGIIANRANSGHTALQKRRLGLSSVSPFKRPRSSRFITPLNKNVSHVSSGSSMLSAVQHSSRIAISTRYPFQVPRMSLEEYFGVPPSSDRMLKNISDQVRCMTSDNAEKYVFCVGSDSTGVEGFHHMLLCCGASAQHATKEWVANHYKWIIWKLACYDRCYPAKSAGKFLTICNVFEELKYRYEREANHGHRSTLKRILEGDSSPSSAMVLCISAIRKPKVDTSPVAGVETANNVKVELTDGWYAIDASLDVLLIKQLASRKLFVGQKLRIWGAALCGWIGPVTPFEALGTVSLLLNINGTYRVHWADRLGFCKDLPAPLAFRCIKSNGGPVPWTLVGITRIYPVLYKEKLSEGGSIVRSERMENKGRQIYNQRRSSVVESTISDFQRRRGCYLANDGNSEGAKIFKALERAAEPEVLMAEMSSEQLNSFATYKAKLELVRESEMDKSIQKALEDAGLRERVVTSFIRVRVVGLTSKQCENKGGPKDGIITVWKPTEKLLSRLVEGQAYAISGLLPLSAETETLYLQARETTCKWHSLSPRAMNQFRPFFNPRKSILLSNLGEVAFSSEFDIAAYVVHVGEVHTVAHQRKQWMFVTDGTISKFQSGELANSLLAICFYSPSIDDDSLAPINSNLAGSTVGFSNLIKRPKDLVNHMWVADATENSTYYLSFSSPQCSHMKAAADATQSWARHSGTIINKLKDKVLYIIGDCRS